MLNVGWGLIVWYNEFVMKGIKTNSAKHDFDQKYASQLRKPG